MSRVSATPVDGTETAGAAFMTAELTGLGIAVLGVGDNGGRVTPATTDPFGPTTVGAVGDDGDVSTEETEEEAASLEMAVTIGVAEPSGGTVTVDDGESTATTEPSTTMPPVSTSLALVPITIDVAIGAAVGCEGWSEAEQEETTPRANAIAKL